MPINCVAKVGTNVLSVFHALVKTGPDKMNSSRVTTPIYTTFSCIIISPLERDMNDSYFVICYTKKYAISFFIFL
uniref:Uncharacterized protein n=1 Tax=Lepeophtheirus salmonis TaxID=72036 RepID=A0A0K2U217_LEPSM